MRKKPRKKKLFNLIRRKSAITEVVGTLLLLAISISIFSVVYYFVFSIEGPGDKESAHIISYLDDNKIIFEHWGGDPIDRNEMRVLLTVNESLEKMVSGSQFSLINSETYDSTQWEFGEIFSYEDNILRDSLIQYSIVNNVSNSKILGGTIESENYRSGLPSFWSKVNGIPATISNSAYLITASSSANMDNVDLWYQYSPDGVNWGTVGITDESYDSVDSNVGDVDGMGDIGTENNFVNVQDFFIDTNVMTLQESESGGGSFSENLSVDGFTADYQSWTPAGTSPYLDIDDTINHISGTTNNQQAGWFTFEDSVHSGGSYDVTLYVDFDAGDGDDDCDWFLDTNDDGAAEYSGTFSNPSLGIMDTGVITGLTSAMEINNARLRLYYQKSGGGGQMTIDHAYLNVQGIEDSSYKINVEYNWSSAGFTEDTERVCIYVGARSGTEDLFVKCWNGASWTTIGSITNTGWNNFTATGLNSEDYIIQFQGADELLDTEQDSWDIDCIFLHTYNQSVIGTTWALYGNDDAPSWEWDFTFPNGIGHYEFYSIGHYLGLTESKPKIQEAYCEKT